MAITHDKDWDVVADEAAARRNRLNTPWTKTHKLAEKAEANSCLGCGDKKLSKVSAVLCDRCIKQAYDVLDMMEK